jgi:hypothetical protein
MTARAIIIGLGIAAGVLSVGRIALQVWQGPKVTMSGDYQGVPYTIQGRGNTWRVVVDGFEGPRQESSEAALAWVRDEVDRRRAVLGG